MITVFEGDIVTLKRKSGRKLTGCKVEQIIRDHGILTSLEGFVYSREILRSTRYSRVWLDELEELQVESHACPEDHRHEGGRKIMYEALPTIGISRMYQVLAHVKIFPVPIRPVAIASGVDEEDIHKLLAPELYTVIDGHIQNVITLKYLEKLSVGDADFFYQSEGLAVYCKEGRPVWMHVDDETDEDARAHYLAWKLTLAMEWTSGPDGVSAEELVGNIGEDIENTIHSQEGNRNEGIQQEN